MKNRTAYDLIVFDCDGTLVDSEYLNNLATIELLSEQGFPQFDMDYAFEHFIGLKFTTILKNITAETGYVFPADMTKRYVERAQQLIPEYLKPIEGAQELVSAAKEKMKIAVASNGQRSNVLHSLEYTGLLSYFDPKNIFTVNDVKNPKPAPDLYLLAAQKLQAEPSRSLVVEDSIVGVSAGVAANMTVYGFTGVHQNSQVYGERLKKAGAAKVYASLLELKGHLGL